MDAKSYDYWRASLNQQLEEKGVEIDSQKSGNFKFDSGQHSFGSSLQREPSIAFISEINSLNFTERRSKHAKTSISSIRSGFDMHVSDKSRHRPFDIAKEDNLNYELNRQIMQEQQSHLH